MPAVLISRSVDALNHLLRASLAAEETYRRGIELLEKGADHGAIALRAILESHAKQITLLRREVLLLGGEPEDSSGALGFWEKANESFAALFGKDSAIQALEDAEEHGIQAARSILPELEEPERTLVERKVLPALEGHLKLLEALRRPF